MRSYLLLNKEDSSLLSVHQSLPSNQPIIGAKILAVGSISDLTRIANVAIRLRLTCASLLNDLVQKPTTNCASSIDDVASLAQELMKTIDLTSLTLPFPTVIIFPQAIIKKRKSFKFSNFVADKKEFIRMVEKYWQEEIDGFQMFKLTKKLKLLKIRIKKLQWMNGDVLKRVKRLRNQLKANQMEVNNAPHDYKIKEVAALTLAEYNKA
ncbi:hypothetical protein Tco_1287130, partial [Tanacetum coccineum]